MFTKLSYLLDWFPLRVKGQYIENIDVRAEKQVSLSNHLIICTYHLEIGGKPFVSCTCHMSICEGNTF